MKNTKRLIKYISPFKSNLFGAIFSAFVGIALSLMVPILIGKGVDCITARATSISQGFLRSARFSRYALLFRRFSNG